MDEEYYLTLAEEMLSDFSFDEILEANDLQEQDALRALIEFGLVNVPERFII